MAETHDFLNVFEAATLLGIHDQTVRKLARKGGIPGFKVGRDWRFRREALINWADQQQSSQEPRQASVLVVDDEEQICKGLAQIIEDEGFEARTTTSALVGLEMVADRPPDLILLDLKMPGMNGPEFLARLRQKYPHLPVVIVTGHPDSKLMTQAAAHAPVMLLAKPPERAPLQRTLRSLLGANERQA